MQAEIGSPGGFGRVVANMINREAALKPVDGISQCFHLFQVRLGRIETWTPNGMPDVAKNWPELLQKIQGEVDARALTAELENGSSCASCS